MVASTLGSRHSLLFLSGRLASGSPRAPWPLRQCEGSLWGGAESWAELDLQARLALQSPSLKGTGLASPFVRKHRRPASSPRTPGRRAAAF